MGQMEPTGDTLLEDFVAGVLAFLDLVGRGWQASAPKNVETKPSSLHSNIDTLHLHPVI